MDLAGPKCYINHLHVPAKSQPVMVARLGNRQLLIVLSIVKHCKAFPANHPHACRFNTWTLQWTTIAALQRPRAWPSAAVLDQRIYVIGGFDGANRLRCVEVYDPDADAFAFVANMNVCRAGGAAAIL
jgi:hypothetical protein